MRNLKRKKTDEDIKFKYSEVECPICMDEMKIDSRSVTAPCMHEFCLQCIGKWLMESSSRLCPLCKQLVKKIMYSIENKQKYAIIGFPTDFCAGWTVRNKMKSVFDDFDNILRKIYGCIKNLFEKERSCLDKHILSYLVWFANVKIRIKSSETGDEVPLTLLVEQDNDTYLIKDLLCTRLNRIFKTSLTNKIMNDIYVKKVATLLTVTDILLYLEDTIDSEKLAILKSEIQCHLLMNQSSKSSLYLEYYIPLRHNDNDAILFTDNRLVDGKTLAALVTKVLCSFHSIFEEDRMLIAHVSIIHSFCTNAEYSSSYEKLLKFLSEATHFILFSNPFYKKSRLKYTKQIESNLISNKAYDLVKHCFNPDDFDQISQTQNNFEKQFIYIEPVLVDDSSNESDLSSVSSDQVEITDIYVELSDSDEDALQVVSVHGPVFDLTHEFDFRDVFPLHKRCRLTPEVMSSVCELSESSTIAMDEQTCPSVTEMRPSTSRSDKLEELAAVAEDRGDSDSTVSDCAVESVEANRLQINFIYQPSSAEDFYQYLLSDNGPDQ